MTTPEDDSDFAKKIAGITINTFIAIVRLTLLTILAYGCNKFDLAVDGVPNNEDLIKISWGLANLINIVDSGIRIRNITKS